MLKGLRLQGRIVLIVSLMLILGVSLWVGSEKFLHGKPDRPLTPPINAPDKADRFIQTASQNFFYHEFDLAVENYQKAIALFEKRENFKRAARIYESIGDVYKFSHYSKKAEKTYMFAVEYHNKLDDKIGEGRAMKKIGDLYMELSQLDKAGEWFAKAATKVREAEPHVIKAKIYEAQGHYFLKIEKTSEALKSFQQAKDILDKIGYPLGYDNISPIIEKLKRQQKNNST